MASRSLREGDAGERKGFALGTLSAIVAAFVTSQIIGWAAPSLSMLLPGLLLVPMFIFYGRYFDWENGIPWLMFTVALILLAAISSTISHWDELRSFAYALTCIMPFAFLAFSLSSEEAFAEKYLQATAIMMSGWVFYLVWKSGQIGAYSLDFHGGFGRAELSMLWAPLLGLSREHRGWFKMWLLLLVATTLVADFMVFSRMLLATTATGVALLLFHRKKGVFFIVVGCILAVLIFVPDYVIRDYLAWYRYADWEAESPRGLIRGLAWDVIQDNPWWGIGGGNGRYILYASQRYYGAHNAVLTAFLEYGIIGFTLMVFFHVYAGFFSVRLWLHGGLGPYLAVSIGAYVIHSLVEDSTHKPGETLLLAILITYGRWILQRDESEQYDRHRVSVRTQAFEQANARAYSMNSS